MIEPLLNPTPEARLREVDRLLRHDWLEYDIGAERYVVRLRTGQSERYRTLIEAADASLTQELRRGDTR